MLIGLQIKYNWALDVIAYSSVDRPIQMFEEKVVRLAKAKVDRLLVRQARRLRIENL